MRHTRQQGSPGATRPGKRGPSPVLSAHARPRRAPRSAPCPRRHRRSAGDGPKGQGRENAAPKRLTRRAERGEQDSSATRAQRRGRLTRPEPAAALHLPTLDPRGRRGSTRHPHVISRRLRQGGAGFRPPAAAELQIPAPPNCRCPLRLPAARSVGGALRWRRVGAGASFPQGFLAVPGARGPRVGSAPPAAGEAGRAGEGGAGAGAALAGA